MIRGALEHVAEVFRFVGVEKVVIRCASCDVSVVEFSDHDLLRMTAATDQKAAQRAFDLHVGDQLVSTHLTSIPALEGPQ